MNLTKLRNDQQKSLTTPRALAIKTNTTGNEKTNSLLFNIIVSDKFFLQ